MINENFVILGILISCYGTVRYAIDTVRGKTRPNRVTWLLWGIPPIIAFFAEVNEGVGIRSLMTLWVGLGPLCIFVASFVNRKSRWELSRLDYFCGSLSVAAIALWAITQTGIIAIALSITADALAGVPTIIKAFKDSASENPIAFSLGAVNASIALLTVDEWNFANYAFPVYILCICLLLVIIITKVHRPPVMKAVAQGAVSS